MAFARAGTSMSESAALTAARKRMRELRIEQEITHVPACRNGRFEVPVAADDALSSALRELDASAPHRSRCRAERDRAAST